MKGEEHLKKPEQFTRVYKRGSTAADRLAVLKAMPNNLEITRYGISVSKRVGKAVIRNRIKRLVREIIRNAPLKTGWDLVIIARNPAAGSDYHQMKRSLYGLLSRARIIDEAK